MRRFFLSAGTVAGILMLAVLSYGAPVLTLPDFELSSADGATVKSTDLASAGNWLLLYVEARGRSSASLLQSLTKEQYPGLSTRLKIVVGGTTDQVKTLIKRYPDLAEAGWYAASEESITTNLQVHGSPALLALSDKKIAWTANGNLGDPAILRSAILKWLSE